MYSDVRDKGQVEVFDDSIHHGIVSEEGDDAHRAAASRAGERVNFIQHSSKGEPGELCLTG